MRFCRGLAIVLASVSVMTGVAAAQLHMRLYMQRMDFSEGWVGHDARIITRFDVNFLSRMFSLDKAQMQAVTDLIGAYEQSVTEAQATHTRIRIEDSRYRILGGREPVDLERLYDWYVSELGVLSDALKNDLRDVLREDQLERWPLMEQFLERRDLHNRLQAVVRTVDLGHALSETVPLERWPEAADAIVERAGSDQLVILKKIMESIRPDAPQEMWKGLGALIEQDIRNTVMAADKIAGLLGEFDRYRFEDWLFKRILFGWYHATSFYYEEGMVIDWLEQSPSLRPEQKEAVKRELAAYLVSRRRLQGEILEELVKDRLDAMAEYGGWGRPVQSIQTFEWGTRLILREMELINAVRPILDEKQVGEAPRPLNNVPPEPPVFDFGEFAEVGDGESGQLKGTE